MPEALVDDDGIPTNGTPTISTVTVARTLWLDCVCLELKLPETLSHRPTHPLGVM